MFNSASWTGRGNSPKIEALDLITRERPNILPDRAPLEPTPREKPDLLAEYARLSKTLGLNNPHIDADLQVEKFKAFLRQKDWAIYSLPTVMAYMNEKAAEESAAKSGWHWRPLRAKDDIKNVHFGTPARAWGHQSTERSPASDHYHGPHTERGLEWSNNRQGHEERLREVSASALPYDKLVPIHALRKVAETERDFPDPVSFFVCDYAPAPHIEHPDPFLMAVINNARLNQGVGRFVIDFWDEPGFGLEQMLA